MFIKGDFYAQVAACARIRANPSNPCYPCARLPEAAN